MNNLPELYHLTKVQWDFFGTFTFRQAWLRKRADGRAEYVRFCKFLTWGREISAKLDWSSKNWEKRNRNVLRLEPGEIGGLWHYHFLMQIPLFKGVNQATCHFMKHTWLKGRGQGGWCTVDVFDKQQNGVEYITKCLNYGDRYEFNKFGSASQLKFSPALCRYLNTRRAIGERVVLQMLKSGDRLVPANPGLCMA